MTRGSPITCFVRDILSLPIHGAIRTDAPRLHIIRRGVAKIPTCSTPLNWRDGTMTELTRYQMLIDGAWVDAEDGGTFESANPATGEPWAVIPEATASPADAYSHPIRWWPASVLPADRNRPPCPAQLDGKLRRGVPGTGRQVALPGIRGRRHRERRKRLHRRHLWRQRTKLCCWVTPLLAGQHRRSVPRYHGRSS